jgi:hypothetical protein
MTHLTYAIVCVETVTEAVGAGFARKHDRSVLVEREIVDEGANQREVCACRVMYIVASRTRGLPITACPVYRVVLGWVTRTTDDRHLVRFDRITQRITLQFDDGLGRGGIGPQPHAPLLMP